ncbi:Spastin [Anopheles sinensis]|uniref:Spastin n=1 Tax=Anopheles sinensis TaxID=74873 RepID=A0A084VGU7_ANOSI|nr:Spastin [Anopheles sinensis]
MLIAYRAHSSTVQCGRRRTNTNKLGTLLLLTFRTIDYDYKCAQVDETVLLNQRGKPTILFPTTVPSRPDQNIGSMGIS